MLDAEDHVWKPLFNVECSNPGQVDLNGGALNSFGQKGTLKGHVNPKNAILGTS